MTSMNRRAFLTGSIALLVAPLAAEAQKSEKMARVGILGLGPIPSPQDLATSVLTNPIWISMRELLKALVPNLSKVAVLREDVTTSVLPSCPLSTLNRPLSRLGASA